MFSPLHILSMALLAVLIPIVCAYVIRGGTARVQAWFRVLAILMLFFDPAYWVWEWLTFGKFHPEATLPLYLCSLFWILLPVGVFAKDGFVRQTALANVATVGLLSGIMGYVFNYHINVYPIFSFVGIRTLSFHALMIFGGILLWASGYYKPKPGDALRAFIPVLILLVPAEILHRLYGYDYAYTAGGQGTPITLLSDRLPRFLFLIVFYALLLLLLWLVFYRILPFLQNKWRGSHAN